MSLNSFLNTMKVIPSCIQYKKEVAKKDELYVGSAAIMCLNTTQVAEVMYLSFLFCLIHSLSYSFFVQPIPSLIHSMSHLLRFSPTLHLINSMFHIFCVLRFRLFSNSQILSRLQTQSQNHFYLTRVKK